MGKIRNIIIGWRNFFLDIFSDIKYHKEFQERMNICKQCPDNICGICKHCGCVLKAKTKAEGEECPTGKWQKIDDQGL